MRDVPPRDSGLASGIVNTAFMMGGALGLATLADARSGALSAAGAALPAALAEGYQVVFLVGARFAAVAATLAALLLGAEPAAAVVAAEPIAHGPSP